MSSLDYLDLCRLCLVKDRVSVPIFEGEGDVRQIFLKIAACLPVKVGREDKLPKKICDDCVYKVELFYQFWNTTANAEKQLLQWLGDVSLDDKQGYVTGAHPSLMKPGQNPGENRLDGSVMQQVNDHPNNMGMGMLDSMGMGMPMMINTSGQQQPQQQMTSVPMDSGGVQTVQPVPGPSTQSSHDQRKTSTNQEDDEDESEEDDNSDDECDGDDGMAVKEESEEDPTSSRTIEPTTFVNVSLACDEAGPSGLQQQKIGEMPEMVMPPTDGDPKSGYIAPDPLGPDFLTVKIMDDFFRIPKSLCHFMVRHPLSEQTVTSNEPFKTIKIESEDDRKMTRENNSPISKKSQLIPEINMECPLEEDVTMFEASMGTKTRGRKKLLKVRDKIESPTPEKSSENPQAANDCRLSTENVEDIPRKRRKKRVKNKESVTNNIHSTSLEKSKEIREEPSNKENLDDLDDIPLDLRERHAEIEKTVPKKHGPVMCESCGQSFDRKSQLKVHMVNHSTVKSYKCDVCDTTFKRKSALNTHSELHRGLKYNCDECNFVGSTKVSVRFHVRRMHEKDFKYKCDECGKSFMSNSELIDHKTCHLGTKTFICEFCGKAYLKKSALGAHKRLVHGIVQRILKKDYQCKICDKRFTSEYILQNHAGIHSRKFLCTHCGKEFASNSSLQLHNRMHTGERPFQCRHCAKSFVRSNALVVHELTHSGKRPYVCDLCGKSFTQRTTMMVHRKKHPGNHPPPPPMLLSKLDDTIDTNS